MNGQMWSAPSMDAGIPELDLSKLSDKDVDDALIELQSLLISQSRQFSLGGILSFINLVGRDESGRPLEAGEIHISWFQHIFYCWERDIVPVILAPWGHGKSVNVAILLPLWLLGHNSNMRIKTVCNSDENSVKRVRSVRSMIGGSPK